MTRPYSDHVYLHLSPLPNWRWKRAEALVAGGPHRGRCADDASTVRAVRLLQGDPDPTLDDVRDAVGVYRAGGLWRQVVEAYLLTELTEAAIGERTGLSGAAVTTYGDLFFHVRGDDPLARFHRATAAPPGDRLRTAAVQWGPRGVWAEAEWLAGGVGLTPELREAFERRALMDNLFDADPGAFLRAVDRLRAIGDGLPPGVMHTPRSARRLSKRPASGRPLSGGAEGAGVADSGRWG